MLAACAFAGMMDTKPTDRMYDCLPMYHTVGGLVATGAVLLNGGSVVIREKFSAREFWDDVVRYECTMFQYIGELCRYLVNAPPNPNETRHRIRLACGNGLRPDIWEEFKDRFRIPHILEFYGATEGNVNMFNFEGKPGAVGRVPWFVAHRFPVAVVRFDVEQPAAGAQRAGLLRTLRARRARRGDRPDRQGPIEARQPLRGLCRRKPEREQDPAQRVRQGRRLVPHRRSDAPGRARLFLFRRPHRRHLPLEGRERLDHGSRRGDQRVPRHRRTPTSMA